MDWAKSFRQSHSFWLVWYHCAQKSLQTGVRLKKETPMKNSLYCIFQDIICVSLMELPNKSTDTESELLIQAIVCIISYKHFFPCANGGKMKHLLPLGWDRKLRTTPSWKRVGSTSRTLSVVTHYFLIFLTLKYGGLVLNTMQQLFPQLIYIDFKV